MLHLTKTKINNDENLLLPFMQKAFTLANMLHKGAVVQLKIPSLWIIIINLQQSCKTKKNIWMPNSVNLDFLVMLLHKLYIILQLLA